MAGLRSTTGWPMTAASSPMAVGAVSGQGSEFWLRSPTRPLNILGVGSRHPQPTTGKEGARSTDFASFWASRGALITQRSLLDKPWVDVRSLAWRLAQCT